MANIRSVEEAIKIIETMSWGDEFDGAMAYLKVYDPQNPYVARYEQNPETFKNTQINVATAQYEYDQNVKGNRLDEADLDNVEGNEFAIEEATDLNSGAFEAEVRALKNTTVVDDNGEALSQTEQDQALEAFFISVREETKLMLANSADYTNAADKVTPAQKAFRAAFSSAFAAMLAANAPLRNDNESEQEYAERVVDTVANSEEPYQVSRAAIGVQTSRVHNKMVMRAKYYYHKGHMRLSNYIKDKSKKFGALMNKLTHGAHEIAMQTWEWAKLNKGQVATMTTMSVGAMVGTMATGGAAAIPAIYAAAMGATSWIFPLTNRRNALVKKLEDEGKDASEWKGLKGIKKAYQTMSKKEKKKYYTMAGVMSGLSFAGAGLMGVSSSAAALAEARLGATVARVAGSSAVQGGFLIDTDLEIKKAKKALLAAQAELDENPEDQKLKKNVEKLFKDLADLKKSRNAQRVGLGLTAGLGALSSWMMAGNAAAHAAEANGVPADSLDSDTTHTSGADAVDAAPVAPEVSEAQAYWENYEVPTEYSEDLGITKNDWRFLHNVLTGEFATEEGAAHLGGEQVNSEAFFDNALRNVATFMHEHPEFAEGKTPLKALNDIVRRTAWSLIPENSHADGHLFTIGDFKFAQYNDEMKDIWAVICNGYDADVSKTPAEMNQAIVAVQADGGLEGVVGTRNVRMVGLACQEVVFKRGPSIHHHIPHPTPSVPVTPPVEHEVPHTHSTTTDIPQKEVPLVKSETVANIPHDTPVQHSETVVNVEKENNVVQAQVNDATGVEGKNGGGRQLPKNPGNVHTQGNVDVGLDSNGNPATFINRSRGGR